MLPSTSSFAPLKSEDAAAYADAVACQPASAFHTLDTESALLPFRGSVLEMDPRDCWCAPPGASAQYACACLRASSPVFSDQTARICVGCVVCFRHASSTLRTGVVFSLRRECIDAVVFYAREAAVAAVPPSAVVDVAGPARGPLLEDFVRWVESTRCIPVELLRWSQLPLSDRARIRYAYGSQQQDFDELARKRPSPSGLSCLAPALKLQRPGSIGLGSLSAAAASNGESSLLLVAPPPIRAAKKALPNEAKAILRQWVSDHEGSTRPSVDERRALVAVTGLTIVQVETWFRHYRVRESMRYGPGERAQLRKESPSPLSSQRCTPSLEVANSPPDTSCAASAATSRCASDAENDLDSSAAPTSPETGPEPASVASVASASSSASAASSCAQAAAAAAQKTVQECAAQAQAQVPPIKKTRMLSAHSKAVLMRWVDEKNSMPNEVEMRVLAEQAQLTVTQTSNWFRHFRARYRPLKPAAPVSSTTPAAAAAAVADVVRVLHETPAPSPKLSPAHVSADDLAQWTADEKSRPASPVAKQPSRSDPVDFCHDSLANVSECVKELRHKMSALPAQVRREVVEGSSFQGLARAKDSLLWEISMLAAGNNVHQPSTTD
eukprot:m51a1_g7546 hypothetical protein (612) ;mRNA; f:78452-81117